MPIIETILIDFKAFIFIINGVIPKYLNMSNFYPKPIKKGL